MRHASTTSSRISASSIASSHTRTQLYRLSEAAGMWNFSGSLATSAARSPRYLHRLFQEPGATVAGWIRQRRLEGCRRDLTWDLTDPALVSRTVPRLQDAGALAAPRTSATPLGRLRAATKGVSRVGAPARSRATAPVC